MIESMYASLAVSVVALISILTVYIVTKPKKNH